VAAAGVLDELLHGGGDGAMAAVVFIIGGAAGGVDEVALDGTLRQAWHLAVEVLLHADGHRDGLVAGEEVAMAVGGMLVDRADAGGYAVGRRSVLAYLPAQTLLALGALGVETADVGLGLLCKQLFFGDGVLFHIRIVSYLWCKDKHFILSLQIFLHLSIHFFIFDVKTLNISIILYEVSIHSYTWLYIFRPY